MIIRAAIGVLAIVLLGGGALAIQSGESACDALDEKVAAAESLPFAEGQRVQAEAIAACYAEDLAQPRR